MLAVKHKPPFTIVCNDIRSFSRQKIQIDRIYCCDNWHDSRSCKERWNGLINSWYKVQWIDYRTYEMTFLSYPAGHLTEVVHNGHLEGIIFANYLFAGTIFILDCRRKKKKRKERKKEREKASKFAKNRTGICLLVIYRRSWHGWLSSRPRAEL